MTVFQSVVVNDHETPALPLALNHVARTVPFTSNLSLAVVLPIDTLFPNEFIAIICPPYDCILLYQDSAESVKPDQKLSAQSIFRDCVNWSHEGEQLESTVQVLLWISKMFAV